MARKRQEVPPAVTNEDPGDVTEPLGRSENVPLEDDISAEEERRMEDARRNAIVSTHGKDVNASTDAPPARPRDKAA